MSKIDLKNLQRIVAHGMRFKQARHFILEVVDAPRAAKFLAAIPVTPADEESSGPAHATALGFCFRGLTALEVEPEVLQGFQTLAPAFAEGASPRAARRLGDTGASAAAFWDERFDLTRAHALLSLYADDTDTLNARVADLRKMEGSDALHGWDRPLPGRHLIGPDGARREHFGYRDGISQPRIKGIEAPGEAAKSPPFRRVEAGEFLLGHANEAGQNRWSGGNEFFAEGSFCAFRQMRQHVAAFQDAVQWLAAEHGMSRDMVRAKICGRWPDGQRIKPGEEAAPAPAPPSNEFDFSDDSAGEGCPFGAHIRRVNPRGDRKVPPRGRFVLRRGIPYEVRSHDGAAPERGLLGFFFCASLEQQFEFLMRQWIDRPPQGGDRRLTAKDPLAGNHEDPATALPLPRAGQAPAMLRGWRPFVTTRGTLYLFYPGISALRSIA